MKNRDLIYEKKYIFVDGVRIPLAFMDCNEISEKKQKKKRGMKESANTKLNTDNNNEKTEFIEE